MIRPPALKSVKVCNIDQPFLTRWKVHAIHEIHGPAFPSNSSSTMDAIEGMDGGKTERLLLANI